MYAKITMKDGHIIEVENLTEIHFRYDLDDRTAFESDIDSTGQTILNSDIKEFEVFPVKPKIAKLPDILGSATIYRVDAFDSITTPRNRTDFSLEELHHYVNCDYVERVALKDNMEMWIDENGKLNGKKPNIMATKLFKESYPEIDDYIAGDALVCPRGMVK